MPNNTNRAGQTTSARWLHVWTDEERRNKKAQSTNGLGKACRREGSGHEEDHLGSGLGLGASAAAITGWQRVLRIWVKIRAQLVRGHPVIEKVRNRAHHVGRRDFHLHRVEPSPNVHLTDLRSRDTRSNAVA